MVLLPSSLISKLPSLATVIPTGRPQTLPSGETRRRAISGQADPFSLGFPPAFDFGVAGTPVEILRLHSRHYSFAAYAS